MSELKFTLPRFDGKSSSDLTLWQLRLQAILESKSLWHVVQSATTLTMDATDDQNRSAAVFTISGLGNKPLRAVSAYIKDPAIMLSKLRERYASANLSTRMSLIADFKPCATIRVTWRNMLTSTLLCLTNW
jgi:hypothetical protein